MADASTNSNGRLSTGSYLSIGVVVLLLASAWALWSQIREIHDQVVPKIASIEARVEAIADNIQEIRKVQERQPSIDTVHALIEAAILRHANEASHVGAQTKYDELLKRVEALEKR